MSDPQELAAAAARMRKFEESKTLRMDTRDWNRMVEKAAWDREKLADAYLAEHLPDSELALDEPWLRSVGGKREEHPAKVTFSREDALPVGLWDVDDGWKAMLIHAPHAASCIVRGLKTRGQFRRLASALGIQLKEPTP